MRDAFEIIRQVYDIITFSTDLERAESAATSAKDFAPLEINEAQLFVKKKGKVVWWFSLLLHAIYTACHTFMLHATPKNHPDSIFIKENRIDSCDNMRRILLLTIMA